MAVGRDFERQRRAEEGSKETDHIELERRLREVDEDLGFIRQINKAMRLSSEEIRRIEEIQTKSFRNARGEVRAYLSEEEVHHLSLPSGNLTGKEFQEVRGHVLQTLNIINKIPFTNDLERIPVIAAAHHEKLDGSGYPDGLKGKDIPQAARILSVIDSYDAIVSGRPYSPARSEEDALRELDKCAGKQFDPVVVKQFCEYIRLSAASQAAAEQTSAKKKKESVRDIINKIVEKFKRDQINLPVLPNVINDIQKAIRNPISTADDIAKLIERDAVISLRLITTANSPMYRGAEKVQTVRQAVPRLGLKQTQSIVNAIANKNLYQTENATFVEIMEKLWLHSLSSAYAAKAIAKKLSLEDEEKFFLMGLSHDVGKILLLKAIDIVAKDSENLNMEELLSSVQDAHTDFGSALLQRWKFPADFSRVAKMHDDKSFYESKQEPILVANLASNIAHKLGYTPFSGKDAVEIDLAGLESSKLLSLKSGDLDEICTEIKTIMQESAHIF